MVKPGTYKAAIKSYGIMEPKEAGKHPTVTITFEYEQAGLKEEITYFGAMSVKAAEYTMKNLLRCGFKYDDLSALCEPNAFDGREVEIAIGPEEYNGETKLKVKWINELGGAKFKALAKEQAKASLGEYTAYMKGLRAEGVSQPGKKTDDFTL